MSEFQLWEKWECYDCGLPINDPYEVTRNGELIPLCMACYQYGMGRVSQPTNQP